MLTVNIDLQHRLVNGQLGTIKHFSVDTKGAVAKIYINFGDALPKKHCRAPVEKTEVDIRMKSTKTL